MSLCSAVSVTSSYSVQGYAGLVLKIVVKLWEICAKIVRACVRTGGSLSSLLLV